MKATTIRCVKGRVLRVPIGDTPTFKISHGDDERVLDVRAHESPVSRGRKTVTWYWTATIVSGPSS